LSTEFDGVPRDFPSCLMTFRRLLDEFFNRIRRLFDGQISMAFRRLFNVRNSMAF
ncbi:hypothetical protein TorRG33x02_188180, partial [Trema orientale]